MRSIPMRALVLAVICVIPIGATACGNSDDGENGGDEKQKNAAAGTSLAATRAGDDEQQIAATLAYVGRALATGNGRAFCSKLSTVGRKQYVTGMHAWGQRGSCAAIIKQSAALNRKNALPPVTISWVKVSGDTATVKTRGGIAGRSGDTLKASKDDGEWKLSDIGLGGLATN